MEPTIPTSPNEQGGSVRVLDSEDTFSLGDRNPYPSENNDEDDNDFCD